MANSPGPHETPAAPAPLDGRHAPVTARSTIATLPARLRELGRIRLGVQVATKNGGTRPAALETFRFTSPSRSLIDAAAAEFGGTVEEWQPPDGSAQWQVITETAEVDVMVPPTAALDQAYELWRAGGCHRRCNGLVNDLAGAPCACPADPEERTALAADGQACSPVTRLNVMLPQLPDLGVWRVEAHGYYAAVELGGAGFLLDLAAANGRMLPARLRLDQRHVKRPDQPRRDFVVPVLELPHTLDQVLADAGADQLIAGPLPAAALAAHAPPELPTSRRTAPQQRPAPETSDRAALVERVLAVIDDAAIPHEHLEALLAARFDGATAVEELDDQRLRWLAQRTTTDAGVQTLRTAAASDWATAQQPYCSNCGQPTDDLTDAGECRECDMPF